MKGLPHSLQLLLLLLLLAGAINLGKASTCVDNAPPVEEWEDSTPGMLEAGSEHGLVAVMKDYVFSCEGVVTQWRLHWQQQVRESCEIIFDFHVLGPRSSDDNCSLTSVGKNRMIVEVDYDQLSVQDSIFNVSEVDRIRVKPGDTLGLTVKFNQSQSCTRDNSNGTVLVFELVKASQFTSVYYRRVHNDRSTDSETIFNMCNDVNNETEDSGETDGTLFQLYSGAPRITAVVEILQSGDDSAVKVDLELLVGVGASASALVVIVAGLMAIVSVWQCSKRKRRASSTEPSQPQVILKDYRTQVSPEPPPDNEANAAAVTRKVALKPPPLKPPPQCTQYRMQGNVAYGLPTTTHSCPHSHPHPHPDSTTDSMDYNEGYDTVRHNAVRWQTSFDGGHTDSVTYDIPYND